MGRSRGLPAAAARRQGAWRQGTWRQGTRPSHRRGGIRRTARTATSHRPHRQPQALVAFAAGDGKLMDLGRRTGFRRVEASGRSRAGPHAAGAAVGLAACKRRLGRRRVSRRRRSVASVCGRRRLRRRLRWRLQGFATPCPPLGRVGLAFRDTVALVVEGVAAVISILADSVQELLHSAHLRFCPSFRVARFGGAPLIRRPPAFAKPGRRVLGFRSKPWVAVLECVHLR